MNYELKTYLLVGSPSDNEDGISRDWNMNVTTNIVGNRYSQFYRQDTTNFNFLKTDTQSQILEKAQIQALFFITQTYPNT